MLCFEPQRARWGLEQRSILNGELVLFIDPIFSSKPSPPSFQISPSATHHSQLQRRLSGFVQTWIEAFWADQSRAFSLIGRGWLWDQVIAGEKS